MAYYAKDLPIIQQKLMQCNLVDESSHKENNGLGNVGMFMGKVLSAGLQSALSTMQQDVHRDAHESTIGKKVPVLSDDQIISRTEHVLYDTIANNIVRNGGISVEGRKVLAGNMGTSTIVTLPNGEDFDTKVISTTSDFHAKNNRLTLAAAERGLKKPHAGMKSNLEIDYNNLSQVYLDAVAVPANNNINNVMFVENKEGNMVREAVAMKKNTEEMTMKNDKSPDKLAWDRIKKRNSCNLHLDENNNGCKRLSKEMKAERRKAKKIGKHLICNASDYKGIIGLATSDDHNYGIHNGTFSSPDLLSRYEMAYMMDEDE